MHEREEVEPVHCGKVSSACSLSFHLFPLTHINILCVKSILAGSSRPYSLMNGNGMVAIHSPIMAATNSLVHNGSRRTYDRKRVGLSCGKEGMVARDKCWTRPARRRTNKSRHGMTRVQPRASPSADPPALPPSHYDAEPPRSLGGRHSFLCVNISSFFPH